MAVVPTKPTNDDNYMTAVRILETLLDEDKLHYLRDVKMEDKYTENAIDFLVIFPRPDGTSRNLLIYVTCDDEETSWKHISSFTVATNSYLFVFKADKSLNNLKTLYTQVRATVRSGIPENLFIENRTFVSN